jgi:hypothetical protein
MMEWNREMMMLADEEGKETRHTHTGSGWTTGHAVVFFVACVV